MLGLLYQQHQKLLQMPIKEPIVTVEAASTEDATSTDKQIYIAEEASVNSPEDLDEEDFSDIDQKKLLRKLDLRLLPLFTILYLLSFLDRGNIGNAKIEGLTEDLNLVGNQFNMCLTIFFIFYSALEVPSNMVLHNVKPRWYISTTMLLWSIVMTLMGTVNNYKQLLATRALLGIFEAPLFPGISYMLSRYYLKLEILVRQAIFFSAATLAGAFSGLLAAGLSQMRGIGGYEGWRWIFIIEGLLTFVFALVSYVYFPMYPDESSFLTPKERRFITHKIKHSSNAENMKIVATAVPEKSLGEDNASDKSQVWAVLKDWQSWTQLMICYGTLVPLYAMSLFGPTIIYSLGYTSTEAQLLGVPVYALASGWCVFQAWLSDRVGLRAPFMIFDILCIVTGFSVLLGFNTITNPGSQYAAMYVIGIGCAAYPLVVIWLSNNLAGSYKRAIGMAFQIGLGNFSGAFSSNFYRQQDAPQYNLGHALCLGFAVMGLLFSLIAVSGYMYCNKKRRREVAQGKYDDEPPEELIKMGDKSPYFVYRL